MLSFKEIEKCDFCQSTRFEKSYCTGKDKTVCFDCSHDLILCPCCNEFREDEEFLYNQENCDVCCDKLADKFED